MNKETCRAKACHRLSHIITSKVLFEPDVANRQRTRTKDLFSDLLFATFISAQLLQSNSFLSFSAILRHVSFGLPLVLLPDGNQFSVILLSSEGSLRKTCLLNSHLLALIMLWNACRYTTHRLSHIRANKTCEKQRTSHQGKIVRVQQDLFSWWKLQKMPESNFYAIRNKSD